MREQDEQEITPREAIDIIEGLRAGLGRDGSPQALAEGRALQAAIKALEKEISR